MEPSCIMLCGGGNIIFFSVIIITNVNIFLCRK